MSVSDDLEHSLSEIMWSHPQIGICHIFAYLTDGERRELKKNLVDFAEKPGSDIAFPTVKEFQRSTTADFQNLDDLSDQILRYTPAAFAGDVCDTVARNSISAQAKNRRYPVDVMFASTGSGECVRLSAWLTKSEIGALNNLMDYISRQSSYRHIEAAIIFASIGSGDVLEDDPFPVGVLEASERVVSSLSGMCQNYEDIQEFADKHKGESLKL